MAGGEPGEWARGDGSGPVPTVRRPGPSCQQTNSSGKSCCRAVKTSKTHRTTSDMLDDHPFSPLSGKKKRTRRKAKTRAKERWEEERRRDGKRPYSPERRLPAQPPPPGPARVKRCVRAVSRQQQANGKAVTSTELENFSSVNAPQRCESCCTAVSESTSVPSVAVPRLAGAHSAALRAWLCRGPRFSGLAPRAPAT